LVFLEQDPLRRSPNVSRTLIQHGPRRGPRTNTQRGMCEIGPRRGPKSWNTNGLWARCGVFACRRPRGQHDVAAAAEQAPRGCCWHRDHLPEGSSGRVAPFGGHAQCCCISPECPNTSGDDVPIGDVPRGRVQPQGLKRTQVPNKTSSKCWLTRGVVVACPPCALRKGGVSALLVSQHLPRVPLRCRPGGNDANALAHPRGDIVPEWDVSPSGRCWDTKRLSQGSTRRPRGSHGEPAGLLGVLMRQFFIKVFGIMGGT
jgi:hypothetical protein